MAYKIIYHSDKPKRYRKFNMRQACFTMSFFIIFLWIVSVFWPEGLELMKLLVIPGDPDITLQAAEVFAMEMSCGFELRDAMENFLSSVRINGY